MTLETPQQLPSAYDPASVEQRLYQKWLDAGYFTPAIQPGKRPFVVIQPPPNVTGELHLGHAQRATVEDALTRWRRMLGEPALWLPGLDHAGIATQVVVERELAAEGLTRHDLGREKFLERVWDWVRKSRGRISEQHRRLGVSCDWSRETFTLDPGPSRAVRHTFVNLYRKGLIYRGERIINWCPRCATALSDLEVEHRETEGHLYYIHYPLVNGNGRLTVATTRPETLLGDTAVAVNPNDPRYAKFVGKEVVLPILRRRIPVVGDDAVETEFGTGALKVTPGHDPTDFDLGERHGLPIVTVMHPNGAMNAEAGPYAGLDRFEARIQIVEDLQKAGLLERVEEHRHAVGHCQRCTQIVEPMVSKQWFVSIAPLAKPALDVVRDGTVRIVPERFTRIYENWMENLRDWCISRQLWWGHRIPVWYCNACEHEIVEYEDPAACPGCGSIDLRQDEDMLDTWFSSGLWPHSTLGWPDETADLDYFYPTSVMETAHDILFFWVARMIMLGIENTGKAPFHTVFLSGLIRDVEGAKMSKTRGNVLDPIEAIDQYGCDALRFALTVGNAPGNDARLGNAKLEAARNFANKIWNATRYVVRAMEEAEDLRGWSDPQPVHLEDRWIKSSLNKLVARVTRQLEEYQLGEAEQSIYEFLWSEFCDWYIEAAKVRIRNNDGPSPVPMLVHVLETTLRLLHPFMPFVTEEAWSNLVSRAPSERELAGSIMVSPYPVADAGAFDDEAEDAIATVREAIRLVRNARAEFRIPPAQPLELLVDPGTSGLFLAAEAPLIRALARVEPLRFLEGGEQLPTSGAATAVVGGAVMAIPLEGLVDITAERTRLSGELADAQQALERLGARLADAQFLEKAPEEVVERERERQRATEERKARLQELLAQLTE